MISLRRLTKRYGSFTAVDAIDLEVPRGELFGFLGPNGAGKTTTLRMIAGILRPTAGHDRRSPASTSSPIRSRAKCKLGFIPDRPFIYEKLTGAEFLRFVAGLYDQEGPKVEHRARELLALFDLEEWRDELVESYSHGMRQKLIISSAFVHRPEVIVVDEPMVGLDPKAARILKDLFREYTRRGHTIMMSHAHARGRGGAVRSRRRSSQGGKIRALRHDGRAARAAPRRDRRARADLPPAHRRERGARAGRGARCVNALSAARARTRRSRRPTRRLLHLLPPKWLTARARAIGERARADGALRLSSACSACCSGRSSSPCSTGCCVYFRGVPEIGPLLAGKLLGLILVGFFSILLLSNVITALSSFFLARDLDLLVAAPVDWLKLYGAKLLETLRPLELDGGADGGADVRRVRRRRITADRSFRCS